MQKRQTEPDHTTTASTAHITREFAVLVTNRLLLLLLTSTSLTLHVHISHSSSARLACLRTAKKPDPASGSADPLAVEEPAPSSRKADMSSKSKSVDAAATDIVTGGYVGMQKRVRHQRGWP